MTSVLIRERQVWGSKTQGIRPCEVRARDWSNGAASQEHLRHQNLEERNFPGGLVVKNLPCNAGDAGSIPCRATEIPRTAGQLIKCDVILYCLFPPLILVRTLQWFPIYLWCRLQGTEEVGHFLYLKETGHFLHWDQSTDMINVCVWAHVCRFLSVWYMCKYVFWCVWENESELAKSVDLT